MKPSISMLAWYLREYRPVSSIQNDLPAISGVRFLADEPMQLNSRYAYVGAASAFFSDEKYADGCIVVHGQDFLLFHGAELEAIFNALLSAVDFYADWEERLKAAQDAAAPLSRFMALGEEVMEDFFVVADMETRLIASSHVKPEDIAGTTWEYFFAHRRISPSGMDLPLLDEQGEPITQALPYPHREVSSNPLTPDLIVQYLMQESEPIAYVAVNQKDGSPSRMQMQLLPVFCRYLAGAREFTSPRPVVQSAARIFARLLRREDDIGEDALDRFRRKLPSGPFRILFFYNPLREDPTHTGVYVNYLRGRGVLCAACDRGAAALISDQRWEDTVRDILSSSGMSGMRCGVSTPAEEIQAIFPRYRQARFAAFRSKGEEINRCGDLAFAYFLEILRDGEDTAFLLHPAIDALARYDGENQTRLLPTLREYLRQNRNLQKTLERLNIHRSTLKYRIQRIIDLTGIDLDDPEEEAYLRLSLWIKTGP